MIKKIMTPQKHQMPLREKTFIIDRLSQHSKQEQRTDKKHITNKNSINDQHDATESEKRNYRCFFAIKKNIHTPNRNKISDSIEPAAQTKKGSSQGINKDAKCKVSPCILVFIHVVV